MRIATFGLALTLVTITGTDVGSAAPPAEQDAVPIADTQLTLRVERAKGQATVIAVAGEHLTVLTAAHFLSSDDVDHHVLIKRGEDGLPGHVVAVARNPNFQLVPARGSSESAARTLGVDTALVVIEARPRTERERQVLRKVRAADLTRSPFPAGGGQVLPVHIVDQFGVEHVVRAGNHLNPKCLAWGRATYVPQHGDSGAGVFVVRKTPQGELRPVLIGNVSQTDDRGGIASLTYRTAAWVGHALDLNPSPTDRSPSGDCTSQP